jgi:hypothetical protein
MLASWTIDAALYPNVTMYCSLEVHVNEKMICAKQLSLQAPIAYKVLLLDFNQRCTIIWSLLILIIKRKEMCNGSYIQTNMLGWHNLQRFTREHRTTSYFSTNILIFGPERQHRISFKNTMIVISKHSNHSSNPLAQ